MFIRSLVSSRHIVNKARSPQGPCRPLIKVTHYTKQEFNLELTYEEHARVLQRRGITEDWQAESILAGGTVA